MGLVAIFRDNRLLADYTTGYWSYLSTGYRVVNFNGFGSDNSALQAGTTKLNTKLYYFLGTLKLWSCTTNLERAGTYLGTARVKTSTLLAPAIAHQDAN